MSKVCNDYYDPYDQIYENLRKLEDATAALSKMSDILARMSYTDINEKLFRTANTITAQMAKLENLYGGESIISQIEKMELLGKKLYGGYESAIKLMESPAISNYIYQLGQIDNSAISRMFDTADRISKLFELYQSTAVINNIEKALSQLSSIDVTWLKEESTFNIDDVSLDEEGSIVYDGVSYNEEQLSEEFKAEIKAIKKLPLKERVEKIKSKLWAIILLWTLITAIPQASETVKYYGDVVGHMEQLFAEKEHICHTIKETAVLRESPDSKSQKIIEIPYDTHLEVIEDVPRWYRVKYTAEDGINIEGWISKISVEFD